MNISIALRAEADVILYEKGLLNILQDYGTPHVHGSYALDLMTWRDLDIYLETNALSEGRFFELGARIAVEISPVRMNFRNERIAQTEGLPRGLYWGTYLYISESSRWKIDIWGIESEECANLLTLERATADKLTDVTRQIIVSIKAECWDHPEYRRGFSSNDIYTAVLDEHITTYAEFRDYLMSRKGISV